SRAGLALDSKELFLNHQIFECPSFFEAKMKKPAKNNECIASYSIWGKISFGERLGQFCRDLQDDPHWKYEQLSPVQLLAELGINKYSTDDSELSRANWFWSRRPRLLPAVSWISWLIVALGLPFWLVIVPLIGVPILI